MTTVAQAARTAQRPPGALNAKTKTKAPDEVRVEVKCAGRWVGVCSMADLTPGRGVAAVLPDGQQIALFLDRAGQTHAVGNRDPFTGAYVLSRGLLGSTGNDGRPFVASPLLKQRFDLATGRCLDDEEESVPVYATRRR